MQKVQVKFSQWIEEGFNLYKENFKTLVLAAIFVVVFSMVTAFILTGPMLAGLALVILGLRDKKVPKPEAGMVFKGFDCFVPAFLFIAQLFGFFNFWYQKRPCQSRAFLC